MLIMNHFSLNNKKYPSEKLFIHNFIYYTDARRIIFHPECADYNASINYRMLIYSRPLSLYQLSHAYEQSDSGWNMSGKMRHHYLYISIFYVIAVFLL